MPPPASLLEAWKRLLEAQPASRLLIDAATERSWTAAELDRDAQKWADEHADKVRDRVVALAEPNGAGWLTAFLGLLHCNAVIVPLETGEPIDAQRTTAGHVGASYLWREAQLLALSESAIARRRNDGRRLIKLTSGSTGAPKPLVFTDAQILADGRQLCAAMSIRATDLNLGLIPWGHSYGLGNLVAPLFLQGTAIVYGAAPLPHAIAAACARWQPTIFPAVPALLRALAESAASAEQLTSLRTVISAGAPLAPEVARAFQEKFGRRIHNFYGSSETGGISFDATGESAALGRGVGQPIEGVTLTFSRGRRFTVSSPAVFTLGNRRNGHHRMADLGQLSETGELVLLGRSGRFVKIAGRRLNLAEVEHALKQIPGVHDALVVMHAERADALAAAVATDRPSAEIREQLRMRLASWKIPKRLLSLARFPVTARGKTDARQLRELLAQPSREP